MQYIVLFVILGDEEKYREENCRYVSENFDTCNYDLLFGQCPLLKGYEG